MQQIDNQNNDHTEEEKNVCSKRISAQLAKLNDKEKEKCQNV